ncbi:MAG: hypothetical protein ACOC55_03240 [Candidatus Natronoplasma sp.]
MDDLDKRGLFIGLVLLVLGADIVLSLQNMIGSIPFFMIGALLLPFSKESWKEHAEEVLPEEMVELFYYPRLPYFQTFIAFLVFLAAFFIPGFTGMIMVWLGLAVTQVLLAAFKEHIQDRVKLFLAMKFHLFLFFTSYVHTVGEGLYMFRLAPTVLPSVAVLSAWIMMMVHIYLVLKT